ncbi:MAG: hypothetical protein ACSHX4_08550 [Opitutaceae bacterium]
MNETNDSLKPEKATEPEPGFFNRMFTKLDNSMKAKADEAAKNECCSPNDKGKGGKCC